jgi:hypothetical protein
MSYVILIPGILCALAILRGGTRHAFLTVLIPVMVFLPGGYTLRLPHLPPVSFQDVALLALGVGMLLMDIGRWKFSRMDCWVFLFICTTAYSERLPWGTAGAFLTLITSILESWVPYMAGKLLVESPGMRLRTTERVTVMMVIASLLSIPQFFLRVNLYNRFWNHFFPSQWGGIAEQVRWGFGRVEGPYGMAESAGMVLTIGLLLALWLQRWRSPQPEATGYLNRLLRHPKLLVFILAITLWMSQSRGPWIGAIIALSIASIGRAGNPLQRAVLVLGIGLLVAVPLYHFSKEYANGPGAQSDGERQTAQYRSQMFDNYVPIAKQGGAWGWGNLFPRVGGQDSIDNEYLLVWLIQGYVGLAALILVIVDSTLSLVYSAIVAGSTPNRHLVFTLMGIILGITVCIATVALFSQANELWFLVLGWAQAIRPARIEPVQPERQPLREEQGTPMFLYT